MGLAWRSSHVGQRRAGFDVEGLEYAFVVRRATTAWDAYIHPIGCGDPKGVWLYGAWLTADEATDAADRYVVAYVDSPQNAPLSD